MVRLDWVHRISIPVTFKIKIVFNPCYKKIILPPVFLRKRGWGGCHRSKIDLRESTERRKLIKMNGSTAVHGKILLVIIPGHHFKRHKKAYK